MRRRRETIRVKYGGWPGPVQRDVPEMIKDLLWGAVAVTLIVSLIILSHQMVMISRSVNGLVVNTNNQVTTMTSDFGKVQRSVRGLVDSTNRYVIRDEKFKNEIRNSITSVTSDFHILTMKAGNVMDETALTIKSVRKVSESANELIIGVDCNVNGEVIPRASALLDTLNSRIVVLADSAGNLLGCVQGNLDTVAADIHGIAGSPEIPLILKQVRVMTENGGDFTFGVAQVMGDVSEVSEFYKNKLIHPTFWDYLRQISKIALYVGGEIVTPWAITNKVTRVRVVE